MADSRAIGVFDSGLGGLTVVKELSAALPNENIVYFGDTGRVPYGTRSREVIRRYTLEDEAFLLKKNVKLIIAACGTVSSVAADTAMDLPVPFFEVVTHAAKEAVMVTENGKIGVIGTAATINSESHAKAIYKLMPSAQITAQACSLFVPLVENGWYKEDDLVVTETVRRYLTPIIEAGCDTLILGCTHYPILTDAIKKVLGNKVKLINVGAPLSKALKEFLIANSLENDGSVKAKQSFYVTDMASSFKRIASSLLGEEIDDNNVFQVNFEDL